MTSSGLIGFCDRRSKTDRVMDASTYESANSLHFVHRFENRTDKTLDGDDLPDPIDGANYKNFSNHSLFSSAGPSELDIRQGSSADCWLMSALGSIARLNPQKIRELIVDFGDGTYGVKIRGRFFRVDADLPTNGPASRELTFAGLGVEDSLWVAMFEKAYAWETAMQFSVLPRFQMGGAYSALVFEESWIHLGEWLRVW